MKKTGSLIALLILTLTFHSNAQTEKVVPALIANSDSGHAARPVARSQSQASLLRGPYLQVATPASMVVRWRTDVLTRGLVRYGTAPDKLDKTSVDSLLVTEHKIKLAGLSPRTRYYYSIGTWQDTLQGGPDNYFLTLPVPGTESIYRIAAIGDCGNNSINQRAVRDQLIHYLGDRYLDSWILLGDNAYSSGRDGEFQSNFFNIYKDNLLIKYPLFPAPGNHDYNDGDRFNAKTAQDTHDVAYYQDFSMPTDGEAGGTPSHSQAYYSYDLGNIHFLSLDSYGREDNQRLYDTLGPQVQWIKKDLAANKNKGWVIAYWHHPPYTMGSHTSDMEQELVHIRENFIRILEGYGVDLILCGHSHDYERSKLMQGHYGLEATFNPNASLVSTSSGMYDGTPNSCPYIKDSTDQGQRGTVYVVSGSAGQLGGKQLSWPHEALPYSDATHGGSSLLEIQGNRLDLRWICADGEIRDHFTMMKQVNRHQVLTIKRGESITLTASFTGDYHWTTGNAHTMDKTGKRAGGQVGISAGKSILVNPSSTTRYTVTDNFNCLKDTFEVQVVR